MASPEQEKSDTDLGNAIINLLLPKNDPDYKDRVMTTWGSKTPAGLARSIKLIIAEHEESNKK